ncbi:MAG: HEAT repeat domain-containing protein [Planctomycetaceae bacterium]|nr:HEAT repeat domain-containing protein [Planctomycetaceae bacterium]
MIRYLLTIGWIGGLATIVCTSARADVFLLNNGGQVEGVLLNPEESPRSTFVVQPREGGQLVLPVDEVERFVAKSEAEARYEEVAPLVEDSEAGHWDMALKCEAAGLKEQQEFHLEQVLRHNTDHEAARRALGFNRVEGRWQRPDEYMAEQGFIRHRGAWRLPQEVAIEQRDRANEELAVAWRKNVKLWREWIVKGRERASEGLANMQAIRDPRAVPALAAQLRQANEPSVLKRLYIEVLSHFPDHGTGIGALTYIALHDADVRVREQALDVLQRGGSQVAILAFLKMLDDNENKMVQRAGVALGYMNKPESTTLPLIEHLITEHKFTVGGGAGITPTFGSGGGGLSMGGKPKVVKEKVKNEAVLHALSGMHQGVNFGYDQDAWKKWYIQQNTPRYINLRRSE